MIYEVRVASKSQKDPKGQDLLAEIKRTLHIKTIKNIKTAKVYRLEGISQKDAKKFTEVMLFEPIDRRISVNRPIFTDAVQIIEVAYKPGVMNPEVASLLKSATDLKIPLIFADSSWEYAFYGQINKEDIEKIIKRLLVNETVEHVVKVTPRTLKIDGKTPRVQKVGIRNLSDDQLMELSKNRLFLNLEEMKVIKNYFKKIERDPTDCEIEVLAQTWSEHCVHKTFNAKLVIDGKEKPSLFERIKKTANFNKKLIVSAFVDNSGVIDFYGGWSINGKVETHNSPSAIEPYGGAMTGSGGVFRDVLGTGLGSKPIASTDIFCFAPPDLPAKELPPGCLPPDYLLRKVVYGVRDYGNRVGIPTNNGSVHFHEDFRAKPTVAVGSFGIIKKSNSQKGKPKAGDLILSIGGRTGRDGVHGATFSSGEMTSETSDVLGSAVQIGNAIEEKRIIDLVMALSAENLIRAVTDCGAGGYSSAIGEMAKSLGAKVYLEKVPLKYAGLAPWEIFISESQERMVIASDPKNLKKVAKLANLYNVELAAIGKFTGDRRLVVTYKKETVCDLSMKFLHEGLPQRKMIGTSIKRKTKEKLPSKNINIEKIWPKVMAHGNVCSKEPIIRMYDHTVQGKNALSPLGGVNFSAPNDGVVIKPILDKPYGLAITHGLNPILVKIDPYKGSVWAITEAVSNFVAIGGNIKNAALIDNFIWPYPDGDSLADLDKSVDACFDMAKILGIPFVSGKDSLSSTYRYPDGTVLKIPPVLLVSAFGKIADVKKTVSSDFKKVNSTIVLVGNLDLENLGGSAYFDVCNASGNVPKVDLKNIKSTLQAVTGGIQSGKILACHDISEGGMAAALAEMCFGAGFGASVDIAFLKTRADLVLFSETAGCFLAEVEDEKTVGQLFAKAPYFIIGNTQNKKNIEIKDGPKTLVKVSIDNLKQAWQKPMKEIFH